MTVLICLLVVLKEEINLFVKITSSLKLSGGIESNSGPCQIIRSVQASFSPGNIALFEKTPDR